MVKFPEIKNKKAVDTGEVVHGLKNVHVIPAGLRADFTSCFMPPPVPEC